MHVVLVVEVPQSPQHLQGTPAVPKKRPPVTMSSQEGGEGAPREGRRSSGGGEGVRAQDLYKLAQHIMFLGIGHSGDRFFSKTETDFSSTLAP